MRVKRDGTLPLWNSPPYVIGDFYVYGGDEGEYDLDENLVQVYIRLCTAVGIPKLKINSAYRTEYYNAHLDPPGAANSKHLYGKALDIGHVDWGQKSPLVAQIKALWDDKTSNLHNQFIRYGVVELIFHDTFVHIAVGPVGTTVFVSDVRGIKNNESGVANKITEDYPTEKSIPYTRNYNEYQHHDSSIKTIKQLMEVDNSIIAKNSITMQDLMEYRGVDNVRNIDRCWKLYSEDQKIRMSDLYNTLAEGYKTAVGKDKTDLKDRLDIFLPEFKEWKEWEINVGTVLSIPMNKTNIEVAAVIGKNLFMEQQSLTTFMDSQLRAIINDPTYIPTQRLSIKNKAYTVNYLNVAFSCWVYIRALGQIMNVTPFIKSLETNVAGGGGTFSVTLSEIMSLTELRKYSETYYSYIQKTAGNKFNLSFFEKNIQQNDIVFIRFEKLDIEKNSDARGGADMFVSFDSLPNQVYDMIGLVDSSYGSYSSEANQSSYTMGGRDLNKMIIEDSAIFFPIAIAGNAAQTFLAYSANDSVFKRLFDDGSYKNAFVAMFRSIQDSIGFIVTQLTHTGVLPEGSKLFSGYQHSYNRYTKKTEDRRSKRLVPVTRYVVPVTSPEATTTEAELQNGVWQIIRFEVDSQLDQRRLNNGELTVPDGPIVDLINRVCMEPLVEFWGDTMGDQFVFIARQPPFTKAQIQDYFNNHTVITVNADKVSSLNLSWEETYYTWYQIQPMDGLFVQNSFIAGTFMPIVYFEEYAQLYGMHKKVISDAYISASALNGEQSETNLSLYRQAIANDYKYMIESCSVLPFTRKGQVFISGGDRRIKKGMWIILGPTDEIAYVTEVKNTATTIDSNVTRETILTVERCMLRKYVLDGLGAVLINGKPANYFSVVDTETIGVALDNQQGGQTTKPPTPYTASVVPVAEAVGHYVKPNTQYVTSPISTSYDNSLNLQILNKDMFNFFSKRKQWQ